MVYVILITDAQVTWFVIVPISYTFVFGNAGWLPVTSYVMTDQTGSQLVPGLGATTEARGIRTVFEELVRIRILG